VHQPKLQQTAAALAACVLLTVAPGAIAASDYFLKLDGVPGESTDEGHRGEIEILSWSWGMDQTGTGAAAARGGRTCLTDLALAKGLDKATPAMLASAASGMVIPTAILVGLRPGGERRQEYLRIELRDVIVTSYQTGGSGGSVPVDSFSLNFSRISVEYTEQKPDGSPGGKVQTTITRSC